MTSQRKKIVNTEEQNRTVNPEDNFIQESSPTSQPVSSDEQSAESTVTENTGDTEKPDAGTESEPHHRVEGDDAGNLDRESPAL